MKNTMKRMLSGIMAMTMVCGVTSISAFAENTDVESIEAANSDDTQFSATNDVVEMPTISVSIPTSDTIVINPFNTKGKGQISSTENVITNNSDIPLNVSLTGVKATGTNIEIVSKAGTAGTKWAVVNFAYTDGLKKTTSKALTSEDAGQDFAISTAMAPKGGKVSFNFNGTCETAIADGDWNNEDKINVSLAYKFTPLTFATYTITDLALFGTDSSEITVAADAEEAAILAMLPTTVAANKGKTEVPVTWTVGEADANGVTAYTATLKTGDDIYSAIYDGSGLTTDTNKAVINVTKEAAESGT